MSDPKKNSIYDSILKAGGDIHVGDIIVQLSIDSLQDLKSMFKEIGVYNLDKSVSWFRESLTPDTANYRETVSLISQLKQCEQDLQSGRISKEKSIVIKNQVFSRFNSLVEELNKEDIARNFQSNISKENKKPIYPHIPVLPEFFVGRDEALEEFKHEMGIGKGVVERPVQTIYSIHGLAGVGKTTFAAALTQDKSILEAFPDGILWTSLGRKPDLTSKLYDWGEWLELPKVKKASFSSEAFSAMRSHLSGKKMLLLIDDIWEKQHAREFLELKKKDCALIFTTRLPGLSDFISRYNHQIPVLKDQDAFELLRAQAPLVVEAYPELSWQLVHNLGGLPLSIVVAGRKLLNEFRMGWGVKALIEELREGRELMLEQLPPDIRLSEEWIDPTVLGVVHRSIEGLSSELREQFFALAYDAGRGSSLDIPAITGILREFAGMNIWDQGGDYNTVEFEEKDAKAIIRELVNSGIMEPMQSGRFKIHPIFISYANHFME